MKKCCYAGCKQKVIGSFSFDIDASDFPYYKKHKQNVSNSIIWAMLGVMELSNAELGLNDKKRTKNISGNAKPAV